METLQLTQGHVTLVGSRVTSELIVLTSSPQELDKDVVAMLLEGWEESLIPPSIKSLTVLTIKTIP